MGLSFCLKRFALWFWASHFLRKKAKNNPSSVAFWKKKCLWERLNYQYELPTLWVTKQHTLISDMKRLFFFLFKPFSKRVILRVQQKKINAKTSDFMFFIHSSPQSLKTNVFNYVVFLAYESLVTKKKFFWGRLNYENWIFIILWLSFGLKLFSFKAIIIEFCKSCPSLRNFENIHQQTPPFLKNPYPFSF